MSKEELIKALALVEHQQRRVGAMRARLRAKRAAILASMGEAERKKHGDNPTRQELVAGLASYFRAHVESPALSPRVLFRGRR